MALNSLLCAHVPLRNYTLTLYFHSNSYLVSDMFIMLFLLF